MRARHEEFNGDVSASQDTHTQRAPNEPDQQPKDTHTHTHGQEQLVEGAKQQQQQQRDTRTQTDNSAKIPRLALIARSPETRGNKCTRANCVIQPLVHEHTIAPGAHSQQYYTETDQKKQPHQVCVGLEEQEKRYNISSFMYCV